MRSIISEELDPNLTYKKDRSIKLAVVLLCGRQCAGAWISCRNFLLYKKGKPVLALLKCQMYGVHTFPHVIAGSSVSVSISRFTFHIRKKRCLPITLPGPHLYSMHLHRHAHGLCISVLLSTFLGQVRSQRYLAEDDDRLTRFVTV